MKPAQVRSYTHASLELMVLYNIPESVRPELHSLIAKELLNGKPVHLTENTQPESCIKIGIDLKYPIHCTERQHTEAHIKEFVKLCNKAIVKYVDVMNMDAFVFQRTHPCVSHGTTLDGIHLMYPDIFVSTDVARLICLEMRNGLESVIGDLPIKNTLETVVDLPVNCWLMYGCSKIGVEPYLLHKVYRATDDDLIELPQNKHDVESLINFLSIHNLKTKCPQNERGKWNDKYCGDDDDDLKKPMRGLPCKKVKCENSL